ncbi:hypothetical protein [Oscillibacter sp.]|uniref:hypothetical protein n=1 Tax=Oscillibacter sp. TaxID=1945593 RepID=UPI002D7E6D59|nr:hypothetical protein [Oscillibacter sp.]
MGGAFDFLTMEFFTRAEVFPGSLGTFRYRFRRTGWMGDGEIQAWVYENVCFELAGDAETETFPWTEEGVAALKDWLGRKLTERGTEPYRIPYPPEQ